MKYLLLACLMLVAVPVGASELSDSIINGSTGPSHMRITKESLDALLRDHPDAKLRVMVIDDPCLARMEDAMRKMEPFIANGFIVVYNFSGWSQSAIDEFHKANELWEETQRECWTKP